jgi:translation initiation factor IF-2
VATDFGYEVEQAVTEEITVLNLEEQEGGGEVLPRPPVVTVMGHVDHGKTSILDAIRKTDVAAGEAGGITQHIGAYYVRSSAGDVVFLDTPGHAAFTSMRSRGAQVTDVVVLVVAADDGVMDQTKEAINHAQAAKVPIVVAVNKIDKANANPDRVKRELAELGLSPEEWGGDTIYCETSAKQNQGIDELLNNILLQAEILELKADPKRKARGRVIEAQLHKGRGPVATILVQDGTLKTGVPFVVGQHHGKVRSLINDKGEIIKEAGPAMPVEVQGLSGVPLAGDECIEVSDDKMARSVSSSRQQKARESELASITKISLDKLFEQMKEGEVKELRAILRSDVQGTLEAFGKAIEELSTAAIKVRVLHEGTGTITDSDVLLASASDAIIIGFNVRPSVKIKELAEKEKVDIRSYDVIYNALDDIKKAMTGMLEPTLEERVIGSAEVRETFHVPKIGTIAGSFVVDGKVERNAKARVLREGVVIYNGKIGSLRRFKDDAKEVTSGYECGIGIENFNDIKVGDTIEAYIEEEVAAKL